jgi:hypothetical protein
MINICENLHVNPQHSIEKRFWRWDTTNKEVQPETKCVF